MCGLGPARSFRPMAVHRPRWFLRFRRFVGRFSSYPVRADGPRKSTGPGCEIRDHVAVSGPGAPIWGASLGATANGTPRYPDEGPGPEPFILQTLRGAGL